MKKPFVVLIALAGVLLAAACGPAATAAPTAAPPTSPPTAAPATAVPPTKAPTLAPPTATAVPPTAEPTPDLLAQITAFQAAVDQQDTEGLLALFVADPRWTLLLGPLTGYASPANTQALRNNLEFEYALHMQLEATDCTVKNDQVACVLLIKDDCTPPAVDRYHFHTQFTLTDGKIANVFGRWDSSDEQAFLAYDAARLAWARESLPEDAAVYSQFTDDLSADTNGKRNEWIKFMGPGEQGSGTLTAAEFGQLVEGICTGYTAASQ